MNKNTIYQDIQQKLMGLAIYINDDISDNDIKDIHQAVISVINKKIEEAIETEYSQETIPIFDSLFTDGEYRKSFYNAIEERIKEMKNV